MAANLMQQVLRGICYLHEQHVAHRDVKDDNFLFLHKAPIEKNVLKLTDFGLSKRCEPGCFMDEVAGTADWVAPEVLRGEYDISCGLTAEQVAEVAGALAAAADHGALREPRGVAGALERSAQTAFSPADLQSMRRAVGILQAPAEEKSSWRTGSPRGLFFVFEGLDRSGKSTQSKLLAKHLEEAGTKVRWTCFPDRATAVGTLIDLYLQRKIELHDECVHQLFSANRWEAAQGIVEDMNA
ncbi:unnamed protein product, partial [Prorocentrum cordatum]